MRGLQTPFVENLWFEECEEEWLPALAPIEGTIEFGTIANLEVSSLGRVRMTNPNGTVVLLQGHTREYNIVRNYRRHRLVAASFNDRLPKSERRTDSRMTQTANRSGDAGRSAQGRTRSFRAPISDGQHPSIHVDERVMLCLWKEQQRRRDSTVSVTVCFDNMSVWKEELSKASAEYRATATVEELPTESRFAVKDSEPDDKIHRPLATSDDHTARRTISRSAVSRGTSTPA
ncbi:hypothetical protein T492DRAFT_908061, partial [Pavlovales sp. CCMP2436]